MAEPGSPERRLHPHWVPELVVLSYCLAWLGAYTCSQVAIHAKYAITTGGKWWWTFLGSVVFGFSAMWCMHFVGMLACRLDVDVTFNYGLTALSSVVSIAFTFLVLSSGYVTEALENSKIVRLVSSCNPALTNLLRSWLPHTKKPHHENGYLPLNTSDTDLEQNPSGHRRENEEEMSNYLDRYSDTIPEDRSDHGVPAHAASPTAHGSDSDPFSIVYPMGAADGPPNSTNWGDALNAALSHETRMRAELQNDKSVDWKTWLWAHYKTASFAVVIKGAIWGGALGFMHYCGMWALEIPGGRIEWNGPVVALSFIVAFVVCFIGCLAMVHMEVHFARQVIFSTLIAAGSGSMHYIGMAAATMYTTAPPSPTAGYPSYLPFVIVGVAVCVCVVSNAVLAHNAIISRNRLQETIVTRRRLWRIMAEKEAAEQANELKQQFISVASHEIRTPLHAVNGYCELLALTNLTEEQKLYLSSIQQACHAINVIAGNVLDFSKLSRNNVEVALRPQMVDLRKMLEDQARIMETKGMQTGYGAGVDVIVAVEEDVPEVVYLDETYMFRILMNLLSNAQKFTDSGYISVRLSIIDDTHPHRLQRSRVTGSVRSSSPSPTPLLLAIPTITSRQLMIEVSDTGCGIPASFRPLLFQPFQQPHQQPQSQRRQTDTNSTCSAAEGSSANERSAYQSTQASQERYFRRGTGLGLSIVKQLVERMGGKISYESVEGSGTMFRAVVPLHFGPEDGETSTIGKGGDGGALGKQLWNKGTGGLNGGVEGLKSSRKKLKVVYSNRKTESLWTDVWSRYGCEVSVVRLSSVGEDGAAELPSRSSLASSPAGRDIGVEDLIGDGVDAVWTDMESVKACKALQELIKLSMSSGLSAAGQDSLVPVLNPPLPSPPQEDPPDVASLSSVKSSPSLSTASLPRVNHPQHSRHPLNTPKPSPLPTIYIVYSTPLELASLRPEIDFSGPGIILVKRPIVMHAVLDTLFHPNSASASTVTPSPLAAPKLMLPPLAPSITGTSNGPSHHPGALNNTSWKKLTRLDQDSPPLVAPSASEFPFVVSPGSSNVGSAVPPTSALSPATLSSLAATPYLIPAGDKSTSTITLKSFGDNSSGSGSNNNNNHHRRESFKSTTTVTGGGSPTTMTMEGGERILLVEDNMVNQQLGKRLLEKLGYEVVTASDGQQAVDAVRKMKFSCCLMDCQMPVLDGFAATSKIREMENNGVVQWGGRLPIIALTANVTGESEEKCRAAGMDVFLPKPLKFSELNMAIRNAISPAGT